ncbi:MAG: 4-hydroxy-tetrahydrodipicolinate synthase [Bacteroidia bacterium]|nr:4-hydroxy-tetrahydrodipicolinate synthase [Bacteroidia bacterium]MCC6768884.1 4-hydroxy-tetrahydrodipicolinate synthase [Bacteroidia bacterium]
MYTHLKGTGVAIVTPFDISGNVDQQALTHLVNHLASNGIDQLVVLGTTGESVVLNKEEKRLVQQIVLEANAGRCRVVLGIGGNNTKELIETIHQTNFNGIDAILSVSPYYNKPSQEGIFQHYKALAAESPKPLLLYNVPGRTGSNITAETTLRIAHEISNVCGIKEASGNLEQVMQIIQKRPKDFLVISGDDALTLPIMAAGGDGVISVSANAFPAQVSALVKACLNGRFDLARPYHYSLAEFTRLLFADGNPGGIKAALKILGICDEVVRLPLVNVRPEIYAGLEREVHMLLKA